MKHVNTNTGHFRLHPIRSYLLILAHWLTLTDNTLNAESESLLNIEEILSSKWAHRRIVVVFVFNFTGARTLVINLHPLKRFIMTAMSFSIALRHNMVIHAAILIIDTLASVCCSCC